MIHETLLHLLANDKNLDEPGKMYELYDFLHPGEKMVLQRIMEISSIYHWIIGFCKEIDNMSCNTHHPTDADPNETENTPLGRGFYIKAFASGVFEVLGEYRNNILQLEELFLQNPQLSLTVILSTLEKHELLLVVLKSVIEVLQKEKISGCLLMGKLHKYIDCGVSPITNATEKITRCVNSIFYQHLCTWIIYGELIDVHNEFFIRDEKCADKDFLYPDQLEEHSASNSGLMIELAKKLRIKRLPPVRKFSINWEMVPTFINEDTAESILFMGRIVWIVRNDPKKLSADSYYVKSRRDIWDGKDAEFYKKVQELENESFDQVRFQSAIEECRMKLTKYLWSIMVDEGHLKEHLQLIRDYYALGRGELFKQFIDVAESHIGNAQQNAHKLNSIFLETARKIYGENDKSYLRFQISASSTDTANTNPWSKLQLNFEINWPLHIVFHPKSIDLYNKLFSYLLRLNKTQIHLHKLWLAHMSCKQNIDRRVGTLRQHLTFLVNNLQYYLQVDVIEAEFSVLLNAVDNANEFEDIIKVHHEFISNLLAKTFVLTPDESHIYTNRHRLIQKPALQFNVPSKVYNVIVRLLELCDNFCLVASNWDIELTEVDLMQLEEFQSQTDTIVETLLIILYRLHEKAKGQHLLQLLNQLDFNRYFSKTKPDFNLTEI